MQEKDISLDWIIENYGDFLMKYSITSQDIINQYLDWHKLNKSEPINKYLLYLLLQTGLFIAKSANTAKEGHEWKVELSERFLEYSKMFEKNKSAFWKKQIEFDKKELTSLMDKQFDS